MIKYHVKVLKVYIFAITVINSTKSGKMKSYKEFLENLSQDEEFRQ